MAKRQSAAERERQMIAALVALGGWQGRAAIARALRKPRLGPYDDKLLAQLKEKDLIEVQQVKRPGIISYSLRYRAK